MDIKLFISLILTFSFILDSYAGSATWQSNPPSNNWERSANWTPRTIPNGPNDTATFAVSATTGVSVTRAQTEVNSIILAAGASEFTITADSGTLILSGTGIVNNSGILQNFVANNLYNIGLHFENQATAGSQTAFTAENASVISFEGESSAGFGTFLVKGNEYFEDGTTGLTFNDSATAASGTYVVTGGGEDAEGAIIAFNDFSTAGSGTFTNTAETDPAAYWGAITDFHDSSTAAASLITNEGGSETQGDGGITNFLDNSTAGNARITSTGATGSGGIPGEVVFLGTSRAENATLIANGGSDGGGDGKVIFGASSDGGAARVELFGNGTLDISGVTDAGVSIGSLEGDGIVSLGTKLLTIGSNNLSTVFSGVIQGNATISAIQVVAGTLTLTRANTYSGGTAISDGGHCFLRVENRNGSATGSGPVIVYVGGTLGGGGIIAGPVSVQGGILAPGTGATTLTVKKLLSIPGGGTYLWRVKTTSVKADKVIAGGVELPSGAFFTGKAVGNAALPPGTTFTAIDNTSSDPIAGTFNNLPDGSTVTVGNNTFQANYEGGDGNDLTLSVVQ